MCSRYYPYFADVHNAKIAPIPPCATRRTAACSITCSLTCSVGIGGGLGGVRMGSTWASWALTGASTGACGLVADGDWASDWAREWAQPATVSVRHGSHRRSGTGRRQAFRTMISPAAWSNQASGASAEVLSGGFMLPGEAGPAARMPPDQANRVAPKAADPCDDREWFE